jgi:hypothetical protein
VTIWVVGHGDDLYVRSVKGRTSSWFGGARDRHQAHVAAGGVDKDVDLVETDENNDDIDTAYRDKYHRYAPSILDPILSPPAQAAMLRLVPRSGEETRLRNPSGRDGFVAVAFPESGGLQCVRPSLEVLEADHHPVPEGRDLVV